MGTVNVGLTKILCREHITAYKTIRLVAQSCLQTIGRETGHFLSDMHWFATDALVECKGTFDCAI